MQNKPVCKIQHIGIEGFIRCMEDKPAGCPFAIPLGSAYFCQKPGCIISNEQGSMSTKPVPGSVHHREGDRIAV